MALELNNLLLNLIVLNMVFCGGGTAFGRIKFTNEMKVKNSTQEEIFATPNQRMS